MPDNDNSLGDEKTLLGASADQQNPQSLGDRSTLGGGDGSSISDLGSIGDLPDHDMEIVDLSKRYRIERSLGKGGMGEVLLATDTRLDRQVAIKRIRADVAVGRTASARFLTEAKAVASLSHPNVVGVHDYGRDEQGPFLIMEYVSGGSLLQRCKEGPIELEEAVELACQLCDGLGRAHDAGIIHRDIKPANILLTAEGIPKLTDFGLAKADSRDHTMTMAGAVLGTLDFMPPEQRQDAALTDSRSDLWSLAATIYQMVTGESPKVIRLKKVPQQLRDVLDRGLEEAKEERFQTASEFKNALAQSLRGDVSNATELEQGECPSCGTKNDSQRKFCRNTQCAASLEAACLSCETSIPLWEGVCGQCGSIQADLVQKRIDEMKDLQAEAEKALASAEYTKASQIADGIREQTDPRLQQLRSWAEGFADEVETSKQEQIHKINAAITEADAHEKAYDYAAGIKSLQQIPEPIYTGGELEEIEPAKDILVRLQSKHSRSRELGDEIKAAIQARKLDGLRSKVESLLELLPDRANLLNLQKQLAEREEQLQRQRSTALESAREMLEKQDYESGISILSKINTEVVDDEVSTLRSELESKQELLFNLRSQIDTRASGNQRDTDYLPLLDQYLELDSGNSKILDLRDRLIKERKKQRQESEALAVKNKARKQLYLVITCSVILVVGTVSTLLYVKKQNRIAAALSNGDYTMALELDPSNSQALAMKKAADKKAAIDQSLSAGDYTTVLELDPSNSEGLAMQKAADIDQALSAGDYTTALELDPSNSEGLAMRKAAQKKADIDQALSAGDYTTALELDPSNTQALTMQKAADIDQALSTGDYATVLRLDPSNSEGLAMKSSADNKAAIDKALSSGDYTTVLRLDPSNTQALAMQKAADIDQALSTGDYAIALQLDFDIAKERIAKLPARTNSIGMKLKLIPGGTFTMGEGSSAHQVTLTKPYELGVYEVTQEQYERVMGTNRSEFKGRRNPVENVSWKDAVAFCEKLSALPEERSAGRVYRLPTEAEWEYACRAGTTTAYSFGEDESSLGENAWYSSNSRNRTHPVGEKLANPLGLYDMHGNVWEWCSDWYGDYRSGAVTDPAGASSGSFRVIRGGSWIHSAEDCRSAYRRGSSPSYRSSYYGFRVTCVPSGQ